MKLNKILPLISESTTLRLNAQAQELRAKGINVVNLTAGELDFSTPQVVQSKLKNKLDLNKYTATLGLPELRKQIALHVSRLYKTKFTESEIAVTAGGKQALYFVFK